MKLFAAVFLMVIVLFIIFAGVGQGLEGGVGELLP